MRSCGPLVRGYSRDQINEIEIRKTKFIDNLLIALARLKINLDEQVIRDKQAFFHLRVFTETSVRMLILP